MHFELYKSTLAYPRSECGTQAQHSDPCRLGSGPAEDDPPARCSGCVRPSPDPAGPAGRTGTPHRLADGYYVVVPQDMVGRKWIPDLEAAAAGIATAIHGQSDIVVMGLSAARLHGESPRLGNRNRRGAEPHRPITLTDRQAVSASSSATPTAWTPNASAPSRGRCWRPRRTNRPRPGPPPNPRRQRSRRSDRRRRPLRAQPHEQRLQLATEQRRLASLRRAEDWAEIDHGS